MNSLDSVLAGEGYCVQCQAYRNGVVAIGLELRDIYSTDTVSLYGIDIDDEAVLPD